MGRLQGEELHDQSQPLWKPSCRPLNFAARRQRMYCTSWWRSTPSGWPLVARGRGAGAAGASVLGRGTRRATLVATANILNYELEAPLEAVDLYNQALDLRIPTIDAVSSASSASWLARQDWRSPGSRLSPHDSGDWGPILRPTSGLGCLACGKRTGRSLRTRSLRDMPAAAAAYEVCVSLAPEDAQHHEALAKNLRGPGSGHVQRRR
jgi:hypothetical protein